MSAPDTNVGEGVTVIGSSGNRQRRVRRWVSDGDLEDPGNLLQGSLGLLSSSAAYHESNDGALALPLSDQLLVDTYYENPLLYYNYPADTGAYSNVFTGTGGSDTITTGTDGLGDWVFTTGGGVGFGVAENADTPGGFQHDAIRDGLFGGVYAGGVLAITPNSTTVNLNNPGSDQIFYSQFVGGPVGGIDGGSTSTSLRRWRSPTTTVSSSAVARSSSTASRPAPMAT